MPELSRQRALQRSREAERRARTFLPGSAEARHAEGVARYWRERHRLDQRAVISDDAPLAIRCEPDDTWFEAEVGLAVEHVWDFRTTPDSALRERVEGRLRQRFPTTTIELLPAQRGASKTAWLVRRDGATGATGTASSRGERLEVRIFPRADSGFARRVAEAVASVSGPDAASGRLLRDLATHALRREYPGVRIVEQDPLAQEPGVTVWYVYRDGRAVPRQEEEQTQ